VEGVTTSSPKGRFDGGPAFRERSGDTGFEEKTVKSLRMLFYAISIAAIVTAVAVAPRLNSAPISESEPPAGAEVKIDSFAFTPATLTVPVGAQVTWANRDEIPHNIVTQDETVKSKLLRTDEKFSFTFTKPGTYSYFCSIHPMMKGKIVVQ
jgi:amicyanin